MKTHDLRKRSVQITLALTVALLAGCRSTGYIKSDAAASHLQATAGEVRTESSDLDASMTALNDLVKRPSADLRLQFQRFSLALDQLTAAARRTSDRAASLHRKSAAYFETWDRELAAMKDDQIRKASAARRTEVSGQYETTIRRYQQAQEALMPLIAYLHDIRSALSTDLTIAGLQAANLSADNASEKSARVKTELEQSAGDLDALGVKMSSYVPQAPK